MKNKEQIYTAIAVVVVVVFLGAVRWMKWSSRSQPRPVANPMLTDKRYVELTIHCKKPIGRAEFAAVKYGMRFREVTKAVKLPQLTKNLNEYAKNKEHRPLVLVVFRNPDGSAIEAMFNLGRVVTRRMRVAGDTSPPAEPLSD